MKQIIIVLRKKCNEIEINSLPMIIYSLKALFMQQNIVFMQYVMQNR